jgi:protein gp37
MSAGTKIQWCDYSWSPWIGCSKVSPGCAHCYAETYDKRFGGDHWGKGKPRRRTSAGYWKRPLWWNKQTSMEATGLQPSGVIAQRDNCAGGERSRPRVFPSLCDPFDDEVPIEWLVDFLALIRATPNLDWLLLTKRPESWHRRLSAIGGAYDFGVGCLADNWLNGDAPDNVWIGTSVEDQERADERIPKLLEIPAKVRFLSCEPLLGPVDVTMALEEFQPLNADLSRKPSPIHWLIIGGESGPGARPCNIEWIRSLVEQGKAAGVPVFMKQFGSKPITLRTMGQGYGELRLRHPKGGDPSEWPGDLRVREFPRVCRNAIAERKKVR